MNWPPSPLHLTGPFHYIFLLITLILEIALGVSIYYSFLVLMLRDWPGTNKSLLVPICLSVYLPYYHSLHTKDSLRLMMNGKINK